MQTKTSMTLRVSKAKEEQMVRHTSATGFRFVCFAYLAYLCSTKHLDVVVVMEEVDGLCELPRLEGIKVP